MHQGAQRIVPWLWFNDNAEEAVEFYTSLFKNSNVGATMRYDEESAKASGRPAGSVMTISFTLLGREFGALNGGPQFRFTPAISFIVHCKTAQDVDRLFDALSKGGEVMMPLDKYAFSERYAFLKDRFGVAWQLMRSDAHEHITPSLLFVGANLGKAEEAIQLYTSVFKDAKIQHIERYGEGEESGAPGTVKYASFLIEGQELSAMDGAGPHEFSFNEAVSLLVNCKDQAEIDHFWERLSEGGETGPCGWLKDRFGVSWQVAPVILEQMLLDKDPQKSKRAMAAMLKMEKIDIAALQDAYEAD